jgi:hypothetical protein
VLRDLMLPIFLKRATGDESFAWVYDYHIDWQQKVA